MDRMGRSGSSNGRRYSPREKEQAVRMVRALRRALREELGTSQGTVKRVAEQLGYGVESVRVWVKQADVDAGVAPGMTSADKTRVVELEQEVRELRQANSILRSSATFFAAVSIACCVDCRLHRRPQGRLRDRADLQGTADRPIDGLSREGPSAVDASPARRGARAGAA
jgi:transposase